jgi:hypothetical protein
MKYVLLAIFVFIASLPLQASTCDMDESQGMSHSQHGDMPEDSKMNMDCCDDESTGGCDPMTHCGASASSVVTIDTTLVSIAFSNGPRHNIADSARALIRFDAPPFRPPIV